MHHYFLAHCTLGGSDNQMLPSKKKKKKIKEKHHGQTDLISPHSSMI